MSSSPQNNASQEKTSLASILWLKYLAVIFILLCIYVVSLFYYRYGVDVFPKSLTVVQHLIISAYSVLSMLSELLIPLFFFSGAFVYRFVRLNRIHLLASLKRDLFVILPLGVVLWTYFAYIEEPSSRRFYAMIFDVQQLQPGEALNPRSNTYDLMKGDNLSTLHEKVDTLEVQISQYKQKLTENDSPNLERLIEELQNQQQKYIEDTMVIHLNPLYILMFLVLGMLLGYLIPIHKFALVAILIAIGLIWFYTSGFLEATFGLRYTSKHVYLLGKIGLLFSVNTILMFVAFRIFQRSKRTQL